MSIAISPAGSQEFHCEVTVRAEAASKDQVRFTERTVIATEGRSRSQSGDWTEPGSISSSFKIAQKRDAKLELPKQIVLATIGGKPVSIRVGE